MAVTTVEAKIAEALFARVASFSATPALPVAWPNSSFTPPSPPKYLRVQFVPNQAQRVFIGSGDPHRLIGLLQISVYWPKNAGETAPREIAGQIAAHFPADLRLTSGGMTVRVTKRADVHDMLVEDAAVQIPLTIEFEAWA